MEAKRCNFCEENITVGFVIKVVNKRRVKYNQYLECGRSLVYEANT
jgi:predicted  nucleic acid-binding Zn-ribbon protein